MRKITGGSEILISGTWNCKLGSGTTPLMRVLEMLATLTNLVTSIVAIYPDIMSG